ncbi:hypothetical protein ACSQ67_022645 [Phaseolus vulgaris]
MYRRCSNTTTPVNTTPSEAPRSRSYSKPKSTNKIYRNNSSFSNALSVPILLREKPPLLTTSYSPLTSPCLGLLLDCPSHSGPK